MEGQVGVVEDFFAHVNAAAVKLSAPLKVGEVVVFRHGEHSFEQKIDSIQVDRKPISSAKAGDEVGILVKEKIKKGYLVFRK